MMRHSWSIRLLRAVVALWFVLAGGEHGVVHGCAMHDGPAGSMHAHAMATHGSGAAMHASHGMPDVAAAHTSHDDGAPQPVHACTCVGSCAASAAIVAPLAPPVLRVSIVFGGAVAVSSDARTTRLPIGEHVLPFSNGPPAAALTA